MAQDGFSWVLALERATQTCNYHKTATNRKAKDMQEQIQHKSFTPHATEQHIHFFPYVQRLFQSLFKIYILNSYTLFRLQISVQLIKILFFVLIATFGYFLIHKGFQKQEAWLILTDTLPEFLKCDGWAIHFPKEPHEKPGLLWRAAPTEFSLLV